VLQLEQVTSEALGLDTQARIRLVDGQMWVDLGKLPQRDGSRISSRDPSPHSATQTCQNTLRVDSQKRAGFRIRQPDRQGWLMSAAPEAIVEVTLNVRASKNQHGDATSRLGLTVLAKNGTLANNSGCTVRQEPQCLPLDNRHRPGRRLNPWISFWAARLFRLRSSASRRPRHLRFNAAQSFAPYLKSRACSNCSPH
jgi:hypothetical protein